MGNVPLRWPVARYRFVFEVVRPMMLPDYAGSAFRGAFGHALRRTACMTRMPACASCPLYRSCAYTSIFETPAPPDHALQTFSKIPNPYVLEAPAVGAGVLPPGETLTFSLVLFGRARHQLALIIFAMKRAFEREVCKGSALLRSVCHEGRRQTLIYNDEHATIEPHDQSIILEQPSGVKDVTIHWDTQLRLQKNGKAYGPKDIEPAPFFNALVRRAGLLAEFHGEKMEIDFHALAESARRVRASSSLEWQNWRRYSSRQQQGMFLGGVVGSWTFHDVPEELQMFLELGTWIHVGKNATFGLGCYHLTDDQSVLNRRSVS